MDRGLSASDPVVCGVFGPTPTSSFVPSLLSEVYRVDRGVGGREGHTSYGVVREFLGGTSGHDGGSLSRDMPCKKGTGESRRQVGRDGTGRGPPLGVCDTGNPREGHRNPTQNDPAPVCPPTA